MKEHDPVAAATRLAYSIRSRNFVGYDPFDALNSPLIAQIARSRRTRQLAIQLVRRMPINPRPVLGIPPIENSKGLGLIAAGAAKIYARTRDPQWRELADEAARRAVALAVETGEGVAWAYPFDVQVRWGYYPAGTPNAIATVFVADSLLVVTELLGTPDYGRVAERAAPFLDTLRSLTSEPYYTYLPGGSPPIHNANVLTASLRIRLALRLGADPPDTAIAALDYTLRRQRGDGSWPYGESPGLEWVDGFHTGYVLSALAALDGLFADERLGRAICRGTSFYIDSLFDPDATPRYYSNRTYPVDAHNCATAIRTLVELDPYDPRAGALAPRVLRRSLDLLQTRGGWFLYQRGRAHVKRVPFLRWSDAHMLNAVGDFVLRLG